MSFTSWYFLINSEHKYFVGTVAVYRNHYKKTMYIETNRSSVSSNWITGFLFINRGFDSRWSRVSGFCLWQTNSFYLLCLFNIRYGAF